LEKLRRGESLSPTEESYIIASGVLNDIIQEMLEKLFLSNTNSINNSISNLSQLNASIMDDSKFNEIDIINQESQDQLKNYNLADNEENYKSEDSGESISLENNKDIDLIYSPDMPKDKWLFKYEDNMFDDLANNKPKSLLKRRKKNKTAKQQSQKLMHKILIDFLNPKDLKGGLLRQKQFIRALTLNSINYKEFDELLVKKNLKLLDLNSSESEEEIKSKDFKTRDLVRRGQNLKNLNTLTKTNNKIRQNWKNIFDNANLEENIKLKFMDILSNKSHLKNKIEEKVLEQINNVLTDDLNSDKNNKLSKKFIKLYREETYNLDVEKYDNESKNAFPNPTLFSTKAKILQENKDYLISSYFDFYEDILNDIFNSGNSIFEFNEELKGNSILKNFQKRNKNDRHRAISNIDEQKELLVTNIESLKNSSNARRVNLFMKESLSISDRIRMLSREQQTNLNNNNCIIGNSNSINNNINPTESLDTKSNYDKLGLANQTYINNILLRDFSYKEKLHYIENSRSTLSDNTILENTSRINDSISLSNHAAPSSSIKKNSIFLKTNLLKFFKGPIKNIAGNLHNNGLNSNLIQESLGNTNLNGNFDDTFDENNNKNINRNNDSDGFNQKKNNGESDNDSISLREPLKKKKKRDGKKVKPSKFDQAEIKSVSKKNDDNKPTSFFELSKLRI
jgi:hypothetical protein